MKAYEVLLKLYEDSEPTDSIVKVITVAHTLELAARNAKKLYEKHDETDGEFHWEPISVGNIEGIVLLPEK